MGSSGIRHRTLVGALLAPVLLLAACGSGNDNGSVADPPISSSPSSSSPTKPPHRESPEQFIRRWAMTEKQMENTGETGPYLALSHRCKSCKGLALRVSSFYARGGYVKWRGRTIQAISVYGVKSGVTTYAVHVQSAPTIYKQSSRSPVERLPGGKSTELITVAKAGEAWEVVDFATLAG